MIYLGGASTMWNGIMVLPDYGDPKQFYYLPPPPRLAVDPATGRKVFKLIKLAGGLTDPQGEGLRTGVVFFDCDLALTTEELTALKAHVQEAFHTGAGEVNLAPLLYKSGEVACYVLGEQDWEDNAPPERKNLFVERLQGFGKPSLYGDNRAAFSARLSQEGASMLDASLAAGGPIGISIVYSLKFDALQPAFKFKVEAQWEQIYHYIEEKCGVDLFFFTLESTSIVEELEQRSLLRFEEVVYDPGASGEVDQLRKQMQQYILEKFFTPVLSADNPRYNMIPGLVGEVARSLAVQPSCGYRRRELTQDERRFLSFDSTRVTAVERVIYPQANLFALLPPADIPSYTQEVNSDSDLFFRQLNVQCVLGGFDFARAKIAWVHPRIRYGTDPEEGTDKTFTGMADRMEFKTWLQPGHGFRYRCGYEVAFIAPDDADPDAIYGKELQLTSPEEIRTDRVLAFNPLELFHTRSVEFCLKQGFPTSEFPVVLVEVKHEDDSGYRVERTYKLSAAAQSCRFRARMPRDVEGVTQYRVLYYPATGAAIPSQWQVVNESAVVLDVPFTQSFLVRVYVAEPPAELAWADVSLRYADDDRPGSYQEGRLFFDQDLKPQVWRVNAADPRQRRYEYCFTLFFKDNTELRAAEWIESDAPTLTLGRRVPMQRTVAVQPAGASFDDVQLRDITVTLWPVDVGGSPTELVFEQLDERKDFTYRAANAVQVGYVYEVVYRWRNGRTKSVPGASPAGALLLNVPTQVA